MNDGEAPFIRAVCEAPEDDAPRLIFADWLEENGQERRAHFIRQQVRHAQPPDGSWPAPIESRGRLFQLAAKPVWDMDLGRVTVPAAVALANTGRSVVVWRRGFVGEVHAPRSEWLALARKGRLHGDHHPVARLVLVAGYRWLDARTAWECLSRYRQQAGLPPL